MRRGWGFGALGILAVGGCSSADNRPAGLAPDQSTVDLAGRLPSRAGWALPEASAPAQPPITGGTLLVSRDGLTAVVSDPDEPRLLLVDLAAGVVRRAVALQPGDEPGRIAEDDAGAVHVVLRGAGAVLSVALAGDAPPQRRAVCDEPRGIAWDAVSQRLRVACAEGTLASLPAAGDGAVERVFVDTDLRDVVVQPGQLVVSRFRTADVLMLDRAGAIVSRINGRNVRFVAWRMIARGDDHVMVLHQRESSPQNATGAASQAPADDYQHVVQNTRRPVFVGLSEAALSVVDTTDRTPVFALGHAVVFQPAVVTGELLDASLAVDLALSPERDRLLVAIPGNWGRTQQSRVTGLDGNASTLPAFVEGDGIWDPRLRTPPLGQVTAAAFGADGRPVVQTRSPATLVVGGDDSPKVIPLGGAAVADTGQLMFHSNPTGSITCASCHPEGGDDGHVWNLPLTGLRRTPPLRGGINETAPFHWSGDLHDFSDIVSQVLIRRMGASIPTPAQTTALSQWMEGIRPLVAAVADPAAAERGRAVFLSADVGCASCHAGSIFTNNLTMDVNTGGSFQVPSLRGLRWRAPYLHDGRAPTLAARFAPMGGGESHGKTAALTVAQRDDLIAYLNSL